MSAALSRLMSAAAGVLRNCQPRYTRDEESHFDELASALSGMEGEAAGPVDLDEPVGTTADEVMPLPADPDCQWCAGAGYVHGDPDLTCPQCDERQVIVDAFRAGAEYMRRSASLLRGECSSRVVMPDLERVDAAAAGYVAEVWT